MKRSQELLVMVMWGVAALVFVLGPAARFIMNGEYDRLGMLFLFYAAVVACAIYFRRKGADDK